MLFQSAFPMAVSVAINLLLLTLQNFAVSAASTAAVNDNAEGSGILSLPSSSTASSTTEHFINRPSSTYCTYANRNYELGLVYSVNAAYKCRYSSSKRMYFWCDTPTHYYYCCGTQTCPSYYKPNCNGMPLY